MGIYEKVVQGDVVAAARLMREIEEQSPRVSGIVRKLYCRAGNAHVIGLTGPPGVGKSTLADRLTTQFLSHGKTVGVVAVDPTSPFTGGAVLGDRVRMRTSIRDPGVFVKSLATRGGSGGLANTTGDIICVLDAMGKDVILVETVGMGQEGIEIMDVASTVLLVLAPSSGDHVQHMKSGVMEIADIFVINKASLGENDAKRMKNDLMFSLQLKKCKDGTPLPPIFITDALEGYGIEEVMHGIVDHRSSTAGTQRDRERESFRMGRRIINILQHRILEDLSGRCEKDTTFKKIIEDIIGRKTDPYTAAETMLVRLKEVLKQGGGD
jgi:LAO/AO transport system kinase